METKFQTSFIPRKPLVPNSSAATPPQSSDHASGFLVLIGMVLFGLSVASGIVVFGWEKVEKSNIEKNKVQLEVNKKQFGSDIEFLKKFNTKINLTKRLVEGHTAISEVFTIINSLAVDNVRFSELDFQVPNDPRKDKIELKLKGEALSFPALAYQSDVLAETDKLVDASVADLMLGEKGIISFGLSGVIPLDKILYKNQFAPAATTTSSDEQIQ